MRAGRLRHRIGIQRLAESRDSFGQVTRTWTTIEDNWPAHVKPLAGRELLEARQVNERLSHRVRMRHYAGLTAKDRLLFGDRVLNIESVINVDERGAEDVIMCQEDVN